MKHHNAMRWDGGPGHYEVWYLSATDRGSGLGLWLRMTMRSPSGGGAGECSLWFLAMDAGGATRVACKRSFPLTALQADRQPFALRLAGADLTDRGAAGAIDDVAWELRWTPSQRAAEHVHPALRRARVAQTVLVLPHPDLAIEGTVRLGDREVVLDGARGGQAHLWGSKHARRWAWLHASDLVHHDGTPAAGDWLDGVSVVVAPRGREVGPSTPVVGRVLGDDLRATGPIEVLRAPSSFGLHGWRGEARDGARVVRFEADAPRPSLAGVTYHDPDGELAFCFNSEVASLRASVLDRPRRGRPGWMRRATLRAEGTAHFEYGQRAPVDGVEVLL